jgi:hypothetical protein
MQLNQVVMWEFKETHITLRQTTIANVINASQIETNSDASQQYCVLLDSLNSSLTTMIRVNRKHIYNAFCFECKEYHRVIYH